MQLENYTVEQLLQLRRQLDKAIDKAESCNVAKRVSPRTALFDSCDDETVTTVEITATLLNDFQTLRNAPGEDIRKTLIALMDEYQQNESLNLILCPDVLETRQSYIKYTAQLANYLATNQTHYRQVKVQFDPTTTRLGVFCRKGTETSTLNTSFLGSVTAMLRVYGSAEVAMQDIPMSYLGNRAALKHLLTHKLGHAPRIKWSKAGVTIFAS
jgi:hypothetical protein